MNLNPYQGPWSTSSDTLKNAVLQLKSSLITILLAQNTSNISNDPYVAFSSNLRNKYFENDMIRGILNIENIPSEDNFNYDFDFNALKIKSTDKTTGLSEKLKGNLPSFDKVQSLNLSNYDRLSSANDVLRNEMLYQYVDPFPINLENLPPLPEVSKSILNESTLNSDIDRERLLFMGSSFFEFLVSSTYYKTGLKLPSLQLVNIKNSILNISTLNSLVDAYKLDLNYCLNFSKAFQNYEIFLVYMGSLYETHFNYGLECNGDAEMIDNQESWGIIYGWLERLLGLRKESMNVFDLDFAVKSVQQDLNQLKNSDVEIQYFIEDKMNDDGTFQYQIKINGTHFGSGQAANKKKARSFAALEAAIKPDILNYIKPKSQAFWKRIYLDKAALIRESLNKDSTDLLKAMNIESAEPLISNISQYSSSPVQSTLEHKHNNTVPTTSSLKIASPKPFSEPQSLVLLLSKDSQLTLLNAKEKLYAYFNSKLNIVPHYTYKQIGNPQSGSMQFEASLLINNKCKSVGVAKTKKEAAAKAAFTFLQNMPSKNNSN